MFLTIIKKTTKNNPLIEYNNKLTACRNDKGVTALRSQSSLAKITLSILKRSDTENEYPLASNSSVAPGRSCRIKNTNEIIILDF